MDLFNNFLKKIASIEGKKEIHFFSKKNGHDIYIDNINTESKIKNKRIFNETNNCGGVVLIVNLINLNLIDNEKETHFFKNIFLFKIKKDRITYLDEKQKDIFLKSIYGHYVIKN